MKRARLRHKMDRRKFNRRPTNVPSVFRKLQTREDSALMLDYSENGAYLVTSSPPPKGAVVEVKTGPSQVSVGKVAYVRRLSEEVAGFGVEFLKSSQPTEVVADEAPEPVFDLKARGMREEAFEYYDRLKRVRDFVTKHLSEDVSLTRAAEIATLEKTYFSTFFHQKVGITYRQWLQFMRIKEAMDQISASNCTITETSLACGFQDLRTFERAFKKWTSMVPREYKKLVAR